MNSEEKKREASRKTTVAVLGAWGWGWGEKIMSTIPRFVNSRFKIQGLNASIDWQNII
jgi:hypothetical protein